jgi:hypothetical protein
MARLPKRPSAPSAQRPRLISTAQFDRLRAQMPATDVYAFRRRLPPGEAQKIVDGIWARRAERRRRQDWNRQADQHGWTRPYPDEGGSG